MPSNFTFNLGGNVADFDDAFVRRDLFSTGGLWSWGYNGGNMGNGGSPGTDYSSPIQTIAAGINWKQVSVNWLVEGGIKDDGTLWLWGNNSWGQVGDNTTTGKSSPVQTVAAGTNWKQFSCGADYVGAIKTDGTLWLWGHNNYGQLGDNTTVHKSSPVQTIAGGANWKQVSCGRTHASAIKTDGTLWTWGENASWGALGDNTKVNKSSPVQTIDAGTNWKQVAGGHWHTAAIKTDGTLWSWGIGAYGSLGDNTTLSKSSPVQTIAAGTNWSLVCSGKYYMAATKTDGTLWLWGHNGYGILGDNTTAGKSSPVQTIASGTNWKLVSCGWYNTAAIKTDGTLWTWGNNGSGAMGDNTTVHKSSPVQTIASGTNWKQVESGRYGAAAVKDNY